jgi:energy-coupling factor transport system permease protein
MISDITLGQYLPGKSWLHRMDPRMKIVLSIVYIVAIFLCKHVLSYALILLFTGFLIAVGGIPFKFIRKSLKPIVIVLIITSFINLFWTEGSHQIFSWEIASWWTLTMYWEGVWKALFMVTRVVLLVISVSLFLTYTTSPIQLTDALESLLSPLKAIKIPVHEFAMMMTIALRFIPTLIEETERIMNAQKSRGSDLSSGSLLKRVKAMIPILVPLFISAFQRAMDLATAMECRCYRGGEGRTKLVEFHLSHLDFVMLVLVALLTAAIPLINYFMPLVMQIGLGL